MVTVADVLAHPGLELRAVGTPQGDTEVRWVATSELPDPTPYLQGGEVLLTTGLGTAAWDDEWKEYVARVAGAGVAALGFAVGLTHDQVPGPLVTACRRHRLTLFEVPRPTPFVAVSRAIAALLEDEREHVARRALAAQQALTRAALEADSAEAVLGRLARQVDGAAASVGRDGRVQGGPVGPRADELDLDAVRDEVARMRSRGLRAAAGRSAGGATTIVQPLGVRSRPEAWLAVLVPGTPDEVHRVAVSTAVSLLSLAEERGRERRAADRALRARALELLLRGDVATADVLLGATAAPGAGLPAGQVRVLRAAGPEDALADGLADLEKSGLLAAVAGDLVALAPARRASAVAARLAGGGLLVGVGTAAPAAGLRESDEAAARALAAASTAHPVRTWDALVGGGVLALLGEAAAPYARTLLAPLAGDPDLLATLHAFLTHHGAIGPTAAALGVHRNTVRNRIREVEARWGRSLDDAQVRVDAWVALAAAQTAPATGSGSGSAGRSTGTADGFGIASS